MRQSVSDLLCRVGRDSPHYIIYPAIVGASKHLEKKDAFSGMEDSCCREHIFELFIQPHFSKLRCQSSVNHINLLYNFLICLLVFFTVLVQVYSVMIVTIVMMMVMVDTIIQCKIT